MIKILNISDNSEYMEFIPTHSDFIPTDSDFIHFIPAYSNFIPAFVVCSDFYSPYIKLNSIFKSIF